MATDTVRADPSAAERKFFEVCFSISETPPARCGSRAFSRLLIQIKETRSTSAYKEKGILYTYSMSEQARESTMDEEQKVPFMQRVLDNPFILLFLGVAFPSVLYLIWGIMEIISVPIAG